MMCHTYFRVIKLNNLYNKANYIKLWESKHIITIWSIFNKYYDLFLNIFRILSDIKFKKC